MLTWLVPVYRSAPILVCCQEPLHIGPAKLHSLVWVDPLFDIRDNRTVPSQIRLALQVNLGLCPPRLAQCFPVRAPCSRITLGWTARRLFILFSLFRCFSCQGRKKRMEQWPSWWLSVHLSLSCSSFCTRWRTCSTKFR